MTSTEMLSRLRGLLDEASAGFWTDAQLYQYLDSAQNTIISKLLDKQKQLRLAKGEDYEVETLKPLIKLSTTNISATSNAITISITDLLEIYRVEIYNSTANLILPLTYIGIEELKKRNYNSYTGHSYDSSTTTGQVYCAYYQGTILTSFTNGSFPYNVSGSGGTKIDRMNVYYYAQPTAVSSGQNYTLLGNTHEAGILLAAALASYQNGRNQEGALFSQQAETLIQNL